MVVSSRSKTPWGPWQDSPYNPIVHTYNATETWWSKGHGTLVSTPQDDWYIVYHAYENGFYNLGRQTLLEPIEWTPDGWFKLKSISSADKPLAMPSGDKVARFQSLSDDFMGKSPGLQWRFFREFDTTRFSLAKDGLLLKAKGKSPADCSPMVCIPGDQSYEIETELEIAGDVNGGLILFYNEKMFSGIGLNHDGIIRYERANPLILNPQPLGNKVKLRIRNVRNQVTYYYQQPGKDWNMYEASSEVSSYNHNAFGGFMGLRAGLFCAGKGTIRFSYFKYTRLNDQAGKKNG
jgi:beta-xylosidase